MPKPAMLSLRAEAEYRLLGKGSWLTKIQGLFDGRRWNCPDRSTEISWNYAELEVFQHIRHHREISCTNDSWRELLKVSRWECLRGWIWPWGVNSVLELGIRRRWKLSNRLHVGRHDCLEQNQRCFGTRSTEICSYRCDGEMVRWWWRWRWCQMNEMNMRWIRSTMK